MLVKISSEIEITDPTNTLYEWCVQNLVVTNPMWQQLTKMGKEDTIRYKHIPQHLNLYVVKGNKIILPFGCLYGIWHLIKNSQIQLSFNSTSDTSNKYLPCPIELYDYQEEAVANMVAAKGGVLKSPAGSGKTITMIEVIHRIGRKFLWITHTGDLLRQAKKDFLSLYPKLDIGMITDGKVDIGKDGAIATVQTLSKLDPDLYKNEFDVVVCDECMPGDTKISTPNGYKELKNLQEGDIVYSYSRTGKIEPQKVMHCFKNKAHDIYKINLNNGEKIICTNNHPIYTKRGYVPAEEVKEDDYVLQSLWEGSQYFRNTNHESKKSFGKRICSLFKKVFKDNSSRKKKKKYNSGNEKKMERQHEKMERIGKRKGIQEKQNRSFYVRRTKAKIECESKNDGISYSISRWEWKKHSNSSAKAFRSISSKEARMLSRVSYSYNGKKKRQSNELSNMLQSRYINSKSSDSNRSRWFKSSKFKKTSSRQEKRTVFNWVRVESLEVQKQTSDGTFNGLCTDGYVYNIEVEKNNNYFANDYLVHNCAHVSGSPTLSKMFSKVVGKIPARYKYGCTATDYRGDTMIKTMYTILGMNREGDFEPTHTVPRSKVVSLDATHMRFDIDLPMDYSILNADGTLDYNSLIDSLSNNEERNNIIIDNVMKCLSEGRKQVILCSRVEHCKILYNMLQSRQTRVELLTGSVSAKKREEILNNPNNWDIIVATYSLLKEGVNVKELDTLHMVTPQKDKALVIQCFGRIERFLEDKKQPITYDYVDTKIPYCLGAFKKRQSIIKNRR